MRNRVDLPGHGDRLCLGANNDEQPCQLISTKIAGGKCGSAASRFLRNRHSFYPVTVSLGHDFGRDFDAMPLLMSRMHFTCEGIIQLQTSLIRKEFIR